ncbi:effector-associated domain EAD1-containing protein [Polaromonas sp.]|uniref:GAP1-N1 domain-containing protein n=1 Tax=Polaromonas sp. TaxID=1869339 RepID=UPI00352B2D32
MRLEQAVYGEVEGGGHGLRGSSSSSSVIAAIATQLDLPDGVPPGVQAWSPFVRGFPCDGHYVLARTFLDSHSARGGMVLTHALIANLEDICQADDLAVLFTRLAASIAAIPGELTALEIEMASGTADHPADMIGVANALAEQQGPAIRLGVTEFERPVTAIWRNLWPSMRRSFAFRLSFGPKDLNAQPGPTIVCTPEQLQARWTKYRVVNPDDRTPQSLTAAVLCGQQDAKPFLDLAGELGLEATTLKDLNKLERLHSLVTGVDGFDDLLKAVRLVDGLSSQPQRGAKLKDKLILRIAAQVPAISCKQLMPMRNLDLPSFASTKLLWSAVELLVSRLDFAQAEGADLVALVEASADSGLARPAWRAAVTRGLSAAGLQGESGLWNAIWRWSELSQSAFSTAMGVLRSDEATEQFLVGAAPRKLNAVKAAATLALLVKKDWLKAHGAALAAMFPAREAAEQQLKVDQRQDHTAGLRSALRHATPADMLAATLDLKDQRLVEMCGDLAVTHTKMLSGICCKDVVEQKVWACAIGKRNSLWSAPSNPMEARDTVVAQLGKKPSVFPGLLEALAWTPLADLTAVPDRARVWSLLPASIQDPYLRATAVGWLNEAISSNAVSTPEPELERAVLASSTLQLLLHEASASLKTRLAIVSALPSFSEDVFVATLIPLLQSTRSLSHADAAQLGRLVASRRWKRAVQYLCERLAGRRYDLAPALQQCTSFLNFFQLWTLGISKPTIDDKWRAFEEAACELYSTGPDHEQLWSRAGGKNSDLPGTSQNGTARWHSALKSLRYGSRPQVRDLLRVMCDDFGGNDILRLLASDTDIVGWS